VKSILQKALRRMGFAIKRLPIETLFDTLAINCVIDVGAYHGEYGQLLRAIGYKGRIVSFEPVKSSYDILSKRAAGDKAGSGAR
jgi:hypothetical protein